MKKKVFVDILKDYQELKFIYEYGFPWDDRLTTLLFGKTSQISRRLALALEDGIEDVSRESWQQLQEGAQKSKVDRKIIKKNIYHLSKQLWYPKLFAGYGKTDGVYAEGENDDSETGKLLKKVYDYRELIIRLLYARKDECWIERDIDDVKLQKHMKAEFPDLLQESGSGKISLKRNMWSDMGLRTTFRSDEIAEIFHMVAFFAEFAPLGILGSNFLNRLGKETTHPLIFVRNLPHNHVFEQELVYRCLYAIKRKRMLKIYDGNQFEEIEPVKIVYDNFDMWRRKSKLYVIDKKGRKIPLNGKNYVEVSGQQSDSRAEESLFISTEPVKLDVCFLKNTKGMYGELTEYLEEKRKIFDADAVKTVLLDELVKMDSPYYPENHLWEVEKVSYEINEKNLEGFLEFVDSFGDFAVLSGRTEQVCRDEVCFKGGETKTRKAVLGEESLCNAYTSEGFYQWLEAKTEFHRSVLPPMQIEIDWLYFILRSYPNLCKVFVSDSVYQKLMELTEKSQDGFMLDTKYDVSEKIQDIRKGTVNKYRQIYHAVNQGEILCGKYRDENRSVFPYALQYYAYAADSYEKGKREHPLEIMAYDLEAKRNVLLVYQNINIKEKMEKQSYTFSDLDKIYHCLANAIRYVIEADRGTISRMEEPPEKTMEFLETIWKMDNRSSNSAYQRKLQKQYGKSLDYHQEYLKLLSVADDPMEQAFAKNVFAYWDDKYCLHGCVEDEEQKYQTFLLKCFREALSRYHSRAGLYMKDVLVQISNEDVWSMISGDKDAVINEIAFYNEYLKNERVFFNITEPTEEKIDHIYRLFSDFTCTGELSKDGKSICFTVTYEKFYYRKVHMYLMTLYDEICHIGPEITRNVIEKRIANKRCIGEELWNRDMC